MGPLATRDLPAELTELDPALVKELVGIVEAAEEPSETKELKVAPWFYFTPCAGVRYYTYEEYPSPVQR